MPSIIDKARTRIPPIAQFLCRMLVAQYNINRMPHLPERPAMAAPAAGYIPSSTG